MVNAYVEILGGDNPHEVCYTQEDWNKYTLYFQHCKYHYSNGESQVGYRFIWKRPDGTLQAARGQTRIPSVSILLHLVSEAMKAGWGHFDEDYQ